VPREKVDSALRDVVEQLKSADHCSWRQYVTSSQSSSNNESSEESHQISFPGRSPCILQESAHPKNMMTCAINPLLTTADCCTHSFLMSLEPRQFRFSSRVMWHVRPSSFHSLASPKNMQSSSIVRLNKDDESTTKAMTSSTDMNRAPKIPPMLFTHQDLEDQRSWNEALLSLGLQFVPDAASFLLQDTGITSADRDTRPRKRQRHG
jgi:hypothetical protein